MLYGSGELAELHGADLRLEEALASAASELSHNLLDDDFAALVETRSPALEAGVVARVIKWPHRDRELPTVRTRARSDAGRAITVVVDSSVWHPARGETDELRARTSVRVTRTGPRRLLDNSQEGEEIDVPQLRPVGPKLPGVGATVFPRPCGP